MMLKDAKKYSLWIIGTVITLLAATVAVSEDLGKLDAFGLKQIVSEISDHEERITSIEIMDAGTGRTLEHIDDEVKIIRDDINWIKQFLIENRNQ